jgi:hypothetical protein
MFNPKQPLWMPAGSVRAILAIAVTAVMCVVALRSNIALSADQVVGLGSLVLGFYFLQKTSARPNGE